MRNLAIGSVAAQSGVKVTTVRFYEARGLLGEPERSAGGRRVYQDTDVQRLLFIRHARELGFELGDIRTLMTLAELPSERCSDADVIARRHLTAVEDKIARLERLRSELELMIETCRNDTVAECRIIDALGAGRA